MKILHVSDLHLGKRLEGVLRLDEQRDILNEIVETAKEKEVDVLLVAGDIFDTKVPIAEAEEMFFDFLNSLSENKILTVAISGNHDDRARLSAPRTLARKNGCYLVGDFDCSGFSVKNSVVGGFCGLKLKIKEQWLNLMLLPYPSAAELFSLGFAKDSYSSNVGELIKSAAWVFNPLNNVENGEKDNVENNEKDAQNGNDVENNVNNNTKQTKDKDVNVCMGHLFLTGSTLTGDEAELGTLAQISKDVLPKCDYVALGHIHGKMTVSKEKNAYYSGSVLQYCFDETSVKGYFIVDINEGKTSATFCPFSAGKKLVSVKAKDFNAAKDILQENENAFVEIKYYGKPLLISEIKELKGFKNLVRLTNSVMNEEEKVVPVKARRSDLELFKDFYFSKMQVEPTNAEIEMFLNALKGEEM